MSLQLSGKKLFEEASKVIWITGLSGAGKSSLASELVPRLRAEGKAVIQLDGDELRDVFGAAATNARNHGREGRLELAMQYANLCRIISSQGITVVIATISLFREVHDWNRKNLPGYFEVYLKVPLEELRRRDPKGIYRRFDEGELSNVAGLDLFIDEPKNANWVAEFSPWETPQQLADSLMKSLKIGE
ncbi:adenylyl-sulfate kinase [Azonexus hydrophilus]|uniref:Adenylyl-sulfate kinase n=1 Tax=Azonexus hydrophilus TaxID=418702 RepID=A0A1R1IDR6_9RHOO|nr:adenylyl-sulfate kinase [Azonexus hydrophilus]OMG56834.1 adenylyl-sulfate kinase [Azonexus hydrophilus]